MKEEKQEVIFYCDLEVPDYVFQGIKPIKLKKNWRKTDNEIGQDIGWLASHISVIKQYKDRL